MDPTDGSDSSVSLLPDQNTFQLPDFTGKIQKEGEYPVGQGGFADVWKGVLHLPSGEHKVLENLLWKMLLKMELIISQVAVKVLRIYEAQPEQKNSKVTISWYSNLLHLLSCCCGHQRVRREIAIWQGLNHANVLPLLGVTSSFGPYLSLVSPWLGNGSLMHYLDKNSDVLGVGRRLQLVSTH
jgi:serine/threonine protein kinase